jgi:hypothetical protein
VGEGKDPLRRCASLQTLSQALGEEPVLRHEG